jgi:hypothetical protein
MAEQSSFWDSLAGAGAAAYSGYQTQQAAKEAARANQVLGDRVASYAEFKPYSVSSGFGTGYFDTQKNTAGYEIDPLLARYRDQLYSMGAGALGQVNLDPTQAAQRYFTEQQGLMAPQRQAEDIALRQQMLNRGRIGLGVSPQAMGAGTGGGGFVNPDQYRVDLARSRADAELGVRSRDLAQAEIDTLLGRGTGLFTQGFGVEELGMKPLTMGADLGKAGASAGANMGQSLLATGQASINANRAASLAGANAAQQFTGMFAPQPARR